MCVFFTVLYMFISERKVPLRLNYSKYCNNLTEDNLIRLGALLIDYSTREAVMAMRDVVLDNPNIKIRVGMLNTVTMTTVGGSCMNDTVISFFFKTHIIGLIVIQKVRLVSSFSKMHPNVNPFSRFWENPRRTVSWQQSSPYRTRCQNPYKAVVSP